MTTKAAPPGAVCATMRKTDKGGHGGRGSGRKKDAYEKEYSGSGTRGRPRRKPASDSDSESGDAPTGARRRAAATPKKKQPLVRAGSANSEKQSYFYYHKTFVPGIRHILIRGPPSGPSTEVLIRLDIRLFEVARRHGRPLRIHPPSEQWR